MPVSPVELNPALGVRSLPVLEPAGAPEERVVGLLMGAGAIAPIAGALR